MAVPTLVVATVGVFLLLNQLAWGTYVSVGFALLALTIAAALLLYQYGRKLAGLLNLVEAWARTNDQAAEDAAASGGFPDDVWDRLMQHMKR